jgi:Flp pilus assembly protein TadD
MSLYALKMRTRTWLEWARGSLVLCMPIALLALGACAAWPPGTQKSDDQHCEAGSTPADNTRLVAISQSINQGKLYAALAQLDAMNSSAPKVQLIRADALRRLEKFGEARALYDGLLSQRCFDGQAHHGLGLMLARQGKLDEGIAHLRDARQRMPTDSRMRSDLGYALMLGGRLDDAHFELMTALDLDPQDTRAGRNLLLLTLKRGDAAKAQEMAKKLGLDKATMDKLQTQASELPTLPPNTPAAITAASAVAGSKGEP